jgi:uncharacterized protein YutE (UPF0331/DUF86 family)
MEELQAWDERYFKRRAELLKELDDLVEAAVDIGNIIESMLTVDVDDYMLEAKEALQEYDGIKEDYAALLEKKMKVPPPTIKVDSRNVMLLRKI